MTILIDSGNSRVKVARLPEQSPTLPERTASASTATDTCLTAHTAFDQNDLSALVDWIAQQPPTDIPAWGVNVAGEARRDAIERILHDAGRSILWQRAQPRHRALVNGYARPEQLGADRWVSLVGAATRHVPAGTPFLLASFGTATTIDTVDAHGHFLGGVILPGNQLMRRALYQGTADLPFAQGPALAFPSDTHAAIVSGIAAAQAGAVFRQWLLSANRFEQPGWLCATGGAWADMSMEMQRLFDHALPVDSPLRPLGIHYLPHPVLDGLATLATERD